jgi:hypothetical protein
VPRLVEAPIVKANPPVICGGLLTPAKALPTVTDSALRAALERMAHGIVMRKGA